MTVKKRKEITIQFDLAKATDEIKKELLVTRNVNRINDIVNTAIAKNDEELKDYDLITFKITNQISYQLARAKKKYPEIGTLTDDENFISSFAEDRFYLYNTIPFLGETISGYKPEKSGFEITMNVFPQLHSVIWEHYKREAKEKKKSKK